LRHTSIYTLIDIMNVLFAMENMVDNLVFVKKTDMRCLGLKDGEACESKIAGRSTICKAKACSLLRGDNLDHHDEYAKLIAAKEYVAALDYREWCVNTYKEAAKIAKIEAETKREKRKNEEQARQEKKLAKAKGILASLKDGSLATKATLDYANGPRLKEDEPMKTVAQIVAMMEEHNL
jgi:hypothetical protein